MKSNLEPAQCLEPTRFIDSDHPAIVECVAGLELNGLADKEKAIRIFEFVRDQIEYEFLAKLDPNLYIASNILDIGCGFCCQKAVLQCALGRAAGIPSAIGMACLCDHTFPERIVKAMGTDTLRYHGLGMFHLNGGWLRADATLSPGLVRRKGYRLVEFNGVEEALFAATTLDGQPHGEYTDWMGEYADLPLPEMLVEFKRFWTECDVEALKRGAGQAFRT